MPGSNCAIVGCFACKGRNRGLSFHRIQRKNDIEWENALVRAVNRTDDFFNKEKATICSRHFKEKCFKAGLNGDHRTLIPGSLPTEYMPTESNETPKITIRKKRKMEAKQSFMETSGPNEEQSNDVYLPFSFTATLRQTAGSNEDHRMSFPGSLRTEYMLVKCNETFKITTSKKPKMEGKWFFAESSEEQSAYCVHQPITGKPVQCTENVGAYACPDLKTPIPVETSAYSVEEAQVTQNLRTKTSCRLAATQVDAPPGPPMTSGNNHQDPHKLEGSLDSNMASSKPANFDGLDVGLGQASGSVGNKIETDHEMFTFLRSQSVDQTVDMYPTNFDPNTSDQLKEKMYKRYVVGDGEVTTRAPMSDDALVDSTDNNIDGYGGGNHEAVDVKPDSLAFSGKGERGHTMTKGRGGKQKGVTHSATLKAGSSGKKRLPPESQEGTQPGISFVVASSNHPKPSVHTMQYFPEDFVVGASGTGKNSLTGSSGMRNSFSSHASALPQQQALTVWKVRVPRRLQA